MRINAGKHKGLILKTFDISSTRPTSDMVRQAIFNMLGKQVENSIFLDLFAGTGAVGLEAASRGANVTYFVDENKECIQLIRANAERFTDCHLEIMNYNVFEALRKFKKTGIQFDLIFIDPPYQTDLAEKALKLIAKENLLKPNGIVVWEHDENKVATEVDGWKKDKTKRYGIKFVTLMRQSNE